MEEREIFLEEIKGKFCFDNIPSANVELTINVRTYTKNDDPNGPEYSGEITLMYIVGYRTGEGRFFGLTKKSPYRFYIGEVTREPKEDFIDSYIFDLDEKVEFDENDEYNKYYVLANNMLDAIWKDNDDYDEDEYDYEDDEDNDI